VKLRREYAQEGYHAAVRAFLEKARELGMVKPSRGTSLRLLGMSPLIPMPCGTRRKRRPHVRRLHRERYKGDTGRSEPDLWHC